MKNIVKWWKSLIYVIEYLKHAFKYTMQDFISIGRFVSISLEEM